MARRAYLAQAREQYHCPRIVDERQNPYNGCPVTINNQGTLLEGSGANLRFDLGPASYRLRDRIVEAVSEANGIYYGLVGLTTTAHDSVPAEASGQRIRLEQCLRGERGAPELDDDDEGQAEYA